MIRMWMVALPALVVSLAGSGCWKWGLTMDVTSANADKLRSADSNQPAARTFYDRRLEPSDSVVLHGAGQSDEISFASYSKAVSPSKPMLTMSYVDLHDDIPAYFKRLRAELNRYPDLLIPQIGVSMNGDQAANHYEGSVASGAEDEHLKQFSNGLRSLDRPVFVRIGYEFNGSWNGYAPSPYAAAFRHVVDTVRGDGLQNVAFVWDWSPSAELDAESGGSDPQDALKRAMRYYPGDSWVDWWGVNIFGAAELSATATESFLAEADRHHAPMMIAESTPKGHSVKEGSRVVDSWYKPYFGFIRTHPGVKAFCYIDWDWSVYPQWSDWGDARIEDNDDVLRFYRSEVSGKLYADSRNKKETLALLRAN